MGSRAEQETSRDARWVGGAAAAALLYLALALWLARAVLPDPTGTARIRSGTFAPGGDLRFTIAQVAHNARTLLAAPSELFEAPHCFPMPRAKVLGEHAFGEGLLAALPLALSGEPLLAYNLVVAAKPWIAALAMYALVFVWLRSFPAALVAGLLFGFSWLRLSATGHPFLASNEWTVLAVLALHLLFRERRWLHAGLLALCVSLQLLESFYLVVYLAVFGTLYAAYLAVLHRRTLVSLALPLGLAALAVAGAAFAVFGPYLEARSTWDILGGRGASIVQLRHLGPGFPTYPGTAVLVLAAVALVDRLRRPRREAGYDPRVVFLAGAIAAVWLSIEALTVPLTSLRIPSLYELLDFLPGFDAVRGRGAIIGAVGISGSFLAGWGVEALLRGRSARARVAITALLLAAALTELFQPQLERWAYGMNLRWEATPLRPTPAELELFAAYPEGAVLDLPQEAGLVQTFFTGPRSILHTAFHHRPVAACYNSFRAPVELEIQDLAGRLPDPRALAALHAVGFRTLAFHQPRFGKQVEELRTALLAVEGPARLRAIGRAGRTHAYHLESGGELSSDFASLEPGQHGELQQAVAGQRAGLRFRLANRSPLGFRHPEPFQPSELLLRWRDEDEGTAQEERLRALLPLAVAAGDERERSIEARAPERVGLYRAELLRADRPDRALAIARVQVEAGGR